MMLGLLERNKIYEAIERSGANLKEFELSELNIDPLRGGLFERFQVLIAHNSGSVFRFREGRRGTPSTPYAIADHPTYEVSSVVIDGQNLNFSIKHDFDHLVECINRWADEVNRTYQAPDLWAEMRRSRELITDIQQTDSDNSPFTQDEQRQIATQGQQIKQQIREQFELTNEQIGKIDEKLDDIIEARTRLGRNDWFMYAIGAITTLIIAATVAPGVGEHILIMIFQYFIDLFGGGPPQILA